MTERGVPCRLWIGIFAVIAIWFRWRGLDMVSSDVGLYVIPWYATVASQGVLAAFTIATVNYQPLYFYLMAIIAWLEPWISPLYAIKQLIMLSDVVCALYVWRIVRLIRSDAPRETAWLGFACVLAAPTVILNGSWWGQCDMFYACWLTGTLYYVLAKRWSAACIAFGLAIAFKPHAMLLAPWLVIWLILNQRWREILWIPVVYVASWAPLWAQGLTWQQTLSFATSFRHVDVYFGALAFSYPHYWLAAVLMQLSSCIAYQPYLHYNLFESRHPFLRDPIVTAAMLNLGLMAYFWYVYWICIEPQAGMRNVLVGMRRFQSVYLNGTPIWMKKP